MAFVHLDHHIKRDSIYLVNRARLNISDRQDDHKQIPFEQVWRGGSFFNRLRKPDFQRATNAWDADKCVDFLESLIDDLLIPHVILWSSPQSRYVYVLDGAHRISVLKAWVENDWGDDGRSKEYYARYDRTQIEEAAKEVRKRIEDKIGSFESCRELAQRYAENTELHEFQMSDKQKSLVRFYQRLEDGAGLLIHWAIGDYDYAARSFVKINRGGQQLDDLEIFLIHNRDNTFIRALMAVAGGRQEANFWPNLNDTNPQQLDKSIQNFNDVATSIYLRLFHPSFNVPPTDLNQPFIPITPSYPSQHHLRNLLPLLVDGEICKNQPDLLHYFNTRYPSTKNAAAVQKATQILSKAEEQLKHFTSLTNIEGLSMDIVPLFYWYNWKGGFVSALFYGFIYWILGGGKADAETISQRKLIFSGNRDRFEHIIHQFKAPIAAIHYEKGAGLRSMLLVVGFFQKLIELLHENLGVPPEELYDEVLKKLNDIITTELGIKTKISTRRSARNTVIDTEGKILRLFDKESRCPICGGLVDWKRPHQLEHLIPYRYKPQTTPTGVMEAHQFCNLNGDKIKGYREGKVSLSLPKEIIYQQGDMFNLLAEDDDWGENSKFPEGGLDD